MLMVTPMAILMIVMMPKMYPDKKMNTIIGASGLLIFITCLICLRTQSPISDIQYMKAMIPHHSSAILTSKHANITDPEVRKLADSIIASQQREIAQMKQILARMQK